MEQSNTSLLETTTSSDVLVVDADDFMQHSNGLHILYRLRSKIPGFKITLFTIPGQCTMSFIEEIRKIEWIDMVPHGWMHDTSRECEHWTLQESLDYLDKIECFGFTKGFKAPGWQISDGMYEALLQRGYWVADQTYNNGRRPNNLKAYLLDQPGRFHYHIPNVCGNGISECFDQIVSLSGDFKFIKDII